LFFDYSIDNKGKVSDPSGNQLVNLASSMFQAGALGVSGSYVRIGEAFQMRPDLVSIMEYRDDGKGTEMILKFSGISNPFSLAKDDVLRVPDYSAAAANAKDKAESLSSSDTSTSSMHEQLIKNYYKFAVTDYDGSPSKSLKALMDTKIASGNVNKEAVTSGSTPYINTAGGTAVTIKNGKIYFGDGQTISAETIVNAATTTEGLDEQISAMVSATASLFSKSSSD